MTDLTVSLTNTLVCTVFTLRARRAELPGARLAGFSAVAAAALPMLLLRHSRVAFAAYRRYFFCAYIPLLWWVGALLHRCMGGSRARQIGRAHV